MYLPTPPSWLEFPERPPLEELLNRTEHAPSEIGTRLYKRQVRASSLREIITYWGIRHRLHICSIIHKRGKNKVSQDSEKKDIGHPTTTSMIDGALDN